MKFTITVLFSLLFVLSAWSQIKYDNGPISATNNFVVNGSWGKTNITYRFSNGTNDINGNDEQNAIRQAFQLWADFSPFTFTEVTSNADINILWATSNHGDGGTVNTFDGLNGILAHAFNPDPNNAAGLAGDVHFDDDENWTVAERPVPSGQPIDLVTVAAHEIGHALGLGHSNVNCALMNAFYNGSHRYLAQDDIDGIRSIYGTRPAILTNGTAPCSGGTYFFRNVPFGSTVNWNSSNYSIATVVNSNNQGIVSRNGSANGIVQLRGTINLPCGTTVIENINLSIGISQPGTIQTGPSTPYDIEVYVNPVLGANSYNWYSNGVLVANQHSSGADIPVVCNKYYQVSVAAINACGTSATTFRSIKVSCNNVLVVIATPNPAKSSLNIEIRDDDKTSSLLKDDYNLNVQIKEIQIVDKLGNIVLQKKFVEQGSKIVLDVSKLKADNYYIKVWSGKEWLNTMLLKQ